MPAGTLPKRSRFPWRALIFGLLLLVAIGAYLQPAIKEQVDGFVRSLLSKF